MRGSVGGTASLWITPRVSSTSCSRTDARASRTRRSVPPSNSRVSEPHDRERLSRAREARENIPRREAAGGCGGSEAAPPKLSEAKPSGSMRPLFGLVLHRVVLVRHHEVIRDLPRRLALHHALERPLALGLGRLALHVRDLRGEH